jgi:hypothetical protein
MDDSCIMLHHLEIFQLQRESGRWVSLQTECDSPLDLLSVSAVHLEPFKNYQFSWVIYGGCVISAVRRRSADKK